MKLTVKHIEEVLDTEIQIGMVFIPGEMDVKLTYNLLDQVFTVYNNGDIYHTTKDQDKALDDYNDLTEAL